ncbi:MAG: galactosyldiacylglycerol synthase, partial [Burkholderiaceae bacterium]|nr:galactosyldiacylglycerol synthase [Burkholderiaceae bacterium]
QGGGRWQVRSTNLFEILDPQGQFRRYAGIAPEDLYNLRLRKGWTAGLAQELKLLQASIRIARDILVQRLHAHWLRSAPDLVLSLIPNFNLALGASLQRALPEVPLVTLMTDLADCPPNFWIEPTIAQHLICGTPRAEAICGTPRAEAQALAAGVDPARVHRISGMVLHPDFHAPLDGDAAADRAALGLDPDRPTGVVMFGGHGAATMKPIAQALGDVQLILMCGHNESLARALRGRRANGSNASQAPHAVLGFTTEVRRWMRLGDFFIGKPGPGSLSEAVHLGLPVITFRNAWTMPQERYNTEWVEENALGRVIRSPTGVREAVAALLDDLPRHRAAVARLHNRAVFDVPAILETIVGAAAAARGERQRRDSLGEVRSEVRSDAVSVA